MQDLSIQLFQAGIVCFVVGAVVTPLLTRWQRVANIFANGFSLSGGILMALVSIRLLIDGRTMELQGWRIMRQIYLTVYVDALASFFLLIIAVMASVCAVYASGYARQFYPRKLAGYLGAMMNVFILSLVGVISMNNSATFLIFWEFMALSSFGLVMFAHERQQVRAGGYMYLIMTHVIGVCLSFAFLLLYLYTGSLEFADYYNVISKLPPGVSDGVFFLFFIGFGAKMGLFPINVWLPRAYPVAPSSATALMSSAMIKTAVYAFLRVSFDFLGGSGAVWWGLVVIAIGAVSAFIGILLGSIQNDTKRFLAYSSVENMGIICIGIGAALYFQAINLMLLGALALAGTLYHVLSHSIFKGLLFMSAGAMQQATGTCDVGKLGGLIHKMPFTAFAFLVGGMSLAALPPLCGFMSEWLLIQSMLHMVFDVSSAGVKFFGAIIVAVLGFSGALAAVAVVKHFGMAFLAKPRSQVAEKASEVNMAMRCGMGLLCGLAIVVGVWPNGIVMILQEVIGRYFSVQFNTGMIFYVPFTIPQGISPAAAVVAFIAIGLGLVAIIRFLWGRSHYVLQETWTCGIEHLPKMEYTATAYSQPILRVFRQLLGMSATVKVEQEYAYFPKRITHGVEIGARVGDRVYKPLIKRMVEVFKSIRKIQNGNLQAYLSYMVAALLITLLLIR